MAPFSTACGNISAKRALNHLNLSNKHMNEQQRCKSCCFQLRLHSAFPAVNTHAHRMASLGMIGKCSSASSFHWLSSSIFSVCRRSFVVPHPWHLLLSPLYNVSEHTNHIFSERIWFWQYVSVNISSVAELSPVYCCLVYPINSKSLLP